MKSRQIGILLSIIAVLAIIFTCGVILANIIDHASIPDREPAGFIIPKADIIYQALNNQASTQHESNNPIGFVNADGTDKTFIKLKYRAYQPVFSLEAEEIFFHTNASDPYQLVPEGGLTYFLSSSGIYATCYPFADGFVFPVNGTGYSLVPDASDIKLVDMKTCRGVKSLVEIPDEVPWTKFVDSAYPSASGKSIIISETYRINRDVISIVDIQSGDTRDIIQGGRNASFSPDDQRIAYFGVDGIGVAGIYVANADGSRRKLLVKMGYSSLKANGLDVPYPFWSPDGKTLVYHKCNNTSCDDLSDFSIYKVDVNSGVEQKIVDGGLYPVWIK